jgi:HPt (histidine-containing phosphotransfer) domain-containing protein
MDASTIDLSRLREMTMDDAGLAAEALGIFRAQAEMWSRLLDPSGDPETWGDACHSIKGAARSVGALALGDACARAETLARGQAIGRAQAAVALSEVRDRLGEALEAIAVISHRLAVAPAGSDPWAALGGRQVSAG